MQKFMRAIAAIMLMVTVIGTAGCTKDNLSKPTTEGIYLGVIGFNEALYEKEIGLLNTSTQSSFISFIDGLEMKRGTGLYWADNTAIKGLKTFGEPPKLAKVALVTFSDGLDNVSLGDNETNPENYSTKVAYLNALSDKIRHDEVYGESIDAYTIGLMGNDVTDVNEFHSNLRKLASNDSNAFEVSDMNEALQKFTEIAESLHTVTATASLSLLIPQGYDDGTIVRFTFDNISSTEAAHSTSYIECTYKREENGRRLENITCGGWQIKVSSVSSVEKVGKYYKVVFEDLTKENGDLVSDGDKTYLQLFYKTATGIWQIDSEFEPDTHSGIIPKQESAIIMLVLDCTTSLGDDFSTMKEAAKRFVRNLISSNNGGGNNQTFTINVSANPSNAGTVTGNGAYQQGQSCTVKATANSGYTFSKWIENGTQVSTNANYTFTVNADRTLVANFIYNGGGNAPTGAINGLFTINSSGDHVYFSQGNLQYKASNGTWRFATNQYDYIGDANSNISSSYSGWIDLFGWGTSGWNCGNTYYQPWDSNNSNHNLYGPPGLYDLRGSYANSDWGYYNAISNGGNQSHQWRTLTTFEWEYVFDTRSTTSGIRYAKARVNNVNGVILLPDNWSSSYYSLSSTNTSGATFSSNVISSSTWTNSLEAHGAVFLPAAGYRVGAWINNVGSLGYYWSASCADSDGAFSLDFGDGYLEHGYWGSRYGGRSVRLVCPVQ